MNGQDGVSAGACRPVETVAGDAERKACEAYSLALKNKGQLAALLELAKMGALDPEPAEPPLKGHPSTVTHVHGFDAKVVEFGMEAQDVAGEVWFNGKESWMEPGTRVLIYVQEIEEV